MIDLDRLTVHGLLQVSESVCTGLGHDDGWLLGASLHLLERIVRQYEPLKGEITVDNVLLIKSLNLATFNKSSELMKLAVRHDRVVHDALA